jgi:transposase InsO family protein
MGQHGSARLTVHSRLTIATRVIEQGWTVTEAARAANVSRQTASKWVARFRAEGPAGLRDRSTRPHRAPARVSMRVVRTIERLRRERRWGPTRIGWELSMAASTVYAVLRRLELHRLSRLEPRPAPIRYEWPAPGDLLHLDTKKLGKIEGIGKRFGPRTHRNRGIGWDFAHVAIDDHSRLAYVELLGDEHGITAAAFLERALGFFSSHGIEVRRVMTDNGSPYVSRVFAELLATNGIRHIRTRPYTPRTNGKAEAMVKVLINSWAYAEPYESSAERAAALPVFMDFYNHRRPHGGLNGARPIDRVRR